MRAFLGLAVYECMFAPLVCTIAVVRVALHENGIVRLILRLGVVRVPQGWPDLHRQLDDRGCLFGRCLVSIS